MSDIISCIGIISVQLYTAESLASIFIAVVLTQKHGCIFMSIAAGVNMMQIVNMGWVSVTTLQAPNQISFFVCF